MEFTVAIALIAVAAMGAMGNEIRFYPWVRTPGPRNPLPLARQVGSVACPTINRFGLGVGIGSTPGEFEWCGAPFAERGAGVREALEVLQLVLGGGMAEYHDEHFGFGRSRRSPAPSAPVPMRKP
ncbi:LLM class flavin-dependent oxidoreductase [Actinocrispum sp. NPDC049592]|uniref:LLM class flavin-dependent oxidoreductase n=1 Tax=Actinocrispum sp. NPDC049592 TaxID=3154835 RepID=UPI00342278B6